MLQPGQALECPRPRLRLSCKLINEIFCGLDTGRRDGSAPRHTVSSIYYKHPKIILLN